jgi:hypothetical protein
VSPMEAENRQRMAALVARAWRDQAFAALLVEDPREAIRQVGLPEPREDIDVVFHVDTPNRRNYVIPLNPQPATLSESDLELLASDAVAGQLVLPTIT